MKNIIAVVWDFDKTLVNGYMQDPIFELYGINGSDFWKEVNSLEEKYLQEQNVKINRETIYLNHFINKAKEGGPFHGKLSKDGKKIGPLNNKRLRDLGNQIQFYEGVIEIFKSTKGIFDEHPELKGYGFTVEHYIVSTGFSEMIAGSKVNPYVDNIWGCELIQTTLDSGEYVISEVGYTIDNTTKTRALFEINKGVNIKGLNIDVNSRIPDSNRRVPFSNIIYIADGPSDIPAFSVVKKGGGATLGVYKPEDKNSFEQAKKLRDSQRVDMIAEADYREGKTAYLWINSQILEIANRVKKEIEHEVSKNTYQPPKHL